MRPFIEEQPKGCKQGNEQMRFALKPLLDLGVSSRDWGLAGPRASVMEQGTRAVRGRAQGQRGGAAEDRRVSLPPRATRLWLWAASRFPTEQEY